MRWGSRKIVGQAETRKRSKCKVCPVPWSGVVNREVGTENNAVSESASWRKTIYRGYLVGRGSTTCPGHRDHAEVQSPEKGQNRKNSRPVCRKACMAGLDTRIFIRWLTDRSSYVGYIGRSQQVLYRPAVGHSSYCQSGEGPNILLNENFDREPRVAYLKSSGKK